MTPNRPPPKGQHPAPDAAQPAPPERTDEASLELPHQRDQATDMTAAKPDPLVEQAAKDLAHGLSDTSKGSELDKTYKSSGIESGCLAPVARQHACFLSHLFCYCFNSCLRPCHMR